MIRGWSRRTLPRDRPRGGRELLGRHDKVRRPLDFNNHNTFGQLGGRIRSLIGAGWWPKGQHYFPRLACTEWDENDRWFALA
jgi:hypothetical protein